MVKDPLSQDFELGGKAKVERLVELDLKLLHDLIEDNALVLVRVVLKILAGLLNYAAASLLEVS